MIRTVLVPALFVVLASQSVFGQALGFSLAQGKKRVKIPIEINNNLVIVPVVLNDALPLKFILDTGVRTAILTQKTFSDILNLAYSRKYTISGPGGEKLVDAYVTHNVSLELPGVQGRGHALLVLEEDYLELRNYLGTDVHGILGYELFSRFIVEVDYEKKFLTLTTPDKYHKKRKFHTLPIRVEDTKPYVIAPITLENGQTISAKLLMDSGASHGLMLDPASDTAIDVPNHVVSSVIGRGLGGEITGKVGRIRSVRFGPYTLRDAIANFPDPNSYTDTLRGDNAVFRNGAIGGEIMSRFTVVFNFSKEEVYIHKNAGFRRGFHYNLSGLTIKAKGAALNVFEVTEIRSQSTADKAGVKPGDIITMVNGISADQLNLDLLNGFFNRKPGKRIRLEISRGGVRMKRVFQLEDQI